MIPYLNLFAGLSKAVRIAVTAVVVVVLMMLGVLYTSKASSIDRNGDWRSGLAVGFNLKIPFWKRILFELSIWPHPSSWKVGSDSSGPIDPSGWAYDAQVGPFAVSASVQADQTVNI